MKQVLLTFSGENIHELGEKIVEVVSKQKMPIKQVEILTDPITFEKQAIVLLERRF